MYLDYLTISLCTLLGLAIWRYRRISRLPPGPPASLIGNAHHIPRTEDWKAFKKFADQYGPLISLWLFNSETLVLNDYATANALLNQRSSIYSSRPTFWMSGHLAGRSGSVFLTKSTSSRFKIYRTLLQKTLNPAARQNYRALQATECQVMLKGLMETPDDFLSHLQRNAVAVIMKIAYGYQVDSIDDKFVKRLEDYFEFAGGLNTPGKFWIEFLPILRHVPEWMPGAGFKRLAITWAKELRRLENAPYNWATSQVSTGSYEESFISNNVGDKEFAPTEAEREDILMWCAASLYVGGGATTVSVMTTFFLLMARHPEIQQRAREEIDRVLGGNLPTQEDRPALPYVSAMIKEIMRWGPVLPLGIPHESTEDDGYNGYFIPKNTRVVPNVWAMARDENVYPDPEKFDPTRFLGENQQMDPLKYVFGFGRRICPGMHLAEATIFLNITSILANFYVAKKCGAKGQEIEPEAHWVTGLTTHLKPFPCEITPRAPAALRSMLLAADKQA